MFAHIKHVEKVNWSYTYWMPQMSKASLLKIVQERMSLGTKI